MDWLEANGVGLRYDLAGSSAKTLALLHEMGGSLGSWDMVLPALAADRRVLRYDTRGAGQSEKVRGALALDTMVDDLAALLDALGIDRPIALAGCAVGAAIAIHFAARLPERTAALIAMSPATGLAGERRAAGLQRADAVERDGMRSVVEASLAASYPPVLRGDEARFRAFRARWLGNDPSSFAAISRMLADTEMDGDFARIRCPTLVIAGTHDRLRPPEAVEPIARAIPGARWRVIETGYFMAVQTPQPVADAITAFLAEIGCWGDSLVSPGLRPSSMLYPGRHPYISRAARSHQTKRESSAALFLSRAPWVSANANNEFSPIGRCIKDV